MAKGEDIMKIMSRWSPITYVIEEVQRQGHNTDDWYDGGRRVLWMLDCWNYAMACQKAGQRLPQVEDTINLGTMMEQEANLDGIRHCDVWVGGQACPPPEGLTQKLTDLFDVIRDYAPLDFYRAFLTIHPFKDGNGRTAKVLLNWISRTLESPYFPPNDFWGRSIRNP